MRSVMVEFDRNNSVPSTEPQNQPVTGIRIRNIVHLFLENLLRGIIQEGSSLLENTVTN